MAFYAGRHPLEISGIFTGSGGAITTIVDTPGPFSQFSVGLSMNNAGTVTFAAIRNSGGEGIFTSSGGPITTIADTSGPFSLAGTSSINNSGAVVFFAGLDDGGTGIFTGPDPVRDRVIATGDELFGSTVTILFYDHFGLNDAGQIAPRIALADRREVMVRADPVRAVPEPASLALFGIGLGGVALYPRRRKKA